ncbi:acyloxyacyl hydrolase [Psychroserpens sp.]|uniref:acyloxyacyl hydrolase n=1 Tax=Psychroserpens sp. TaxID=2020870 RepID=UPI001B19231D|nr:acyloxyacyl hydrolase [Psychroserpens sp.]MBO6607925.1 acyloxyacyl hydrolase [Psychroserpens sp.]MBO6631955.1 acyloxyacyl hydrolase [Psychroserpens sp.]MBO6654948.1 acyloxyacyl hydrolase [Psychroserpens sp.]MBO6682978.1 acyloxyacyl hydrolase [Psychroserpens sp.]MBO6751283.1 acyloxyacyl hydrolase [Psychroserpens sp.]
MKRFLTCFFCLLCTSLFAQDEDPKRFSIDANFFYGTILQHNPDIAHLITDHPTGVILAYNRKTYGYKDWEARYNYPDWGFSFVYQDMKNETLGDNYGLYAHYNFYFLKRHLMLRVGQGIAYTTNPYDKEFNFRNSAYGSDLLSSTYLMVNYKKENLFKGLGLQAGISLVHYSNANFRAPNTSTNTFAFNIGTNYVFDHKEETAYIPSSEDKKYKEKIKYNLVFRTGVNESDIIGLGQHPFYILSAYADKRLNRKSAVQAGVDVFFSTFLEELIFFYSVAFPELNVSGDEDWKRVGLIIGHELFINKMSILTQLGYYVYYPYDFEGQVYNRIGLKRYFGDKFFGAVTLKSHGAKAEAVEFGIGVRL